MLSPILTTIHFFGRHLMKRFFYVALLTFVVPGLTLLYGQQAGDKSLQETLKELSEAAAKSYVSPIVSGFGSNLNSGWFHRAPRATMFGIDLEFGIVGMATFFPNDAKTFTSNGSFRFTAAQAADLALKSGAPVGAARTAVQNAILSQPFGVTFSGPTITGASKDSMRVIFTGANNVGGTGFNLPSQTYPLPIVGIMGEVTAIPLVAPQLSIGTFFGTQLTFRYLPTYSIEDFGEIKYFGFGAQHNPGVWFGDILPLELSASFFTQSLEAGSVFKTKATAFGVNASKRLGWGFLNITPYGGFMVESSSMTFTYDYFVDTPAGKIPQKVEFELTGENKTRVTAGLSVKVLIVNINADYSWAKYNSASIGLMFII
ncbi:MAG: hypothetical protein HW374_238 [Bacteroidetes bacterium]|nr:hypothetical protein [Bacteroidota bacterium]